jgi:hypothetical protein
MKQKKSSLEVMAMPKPKPSASISLGDKLALPDVQVGQSVTVTLKGTVRGMRDDEFGKNFDLALHSVKAKGPVQRDSLTDDMAKMKDARTL